MTPQVPLMRAMVPTRRAATSLVSVAVLVLGILGVIAALAGNAGASSAPQAKAASIHQLTAAKNSTGANSLLAQLLAALGKSQGVRSVPTPVAPPTSTTPTAAPSTGSSSGSGGGSSSGSGDTGTTAPAPTSSSSTPSPAPTSSSPSASSPPSSTDPGDPSVAGDTLAWSDEFNGASGSAANPSMWQASIGGKWGGGSELECYTNNRSNSALDGNGDLVITARYQPGYQCSDNTNNYTSARLTTQNLASQEYGAIRVRAKVPVASGVWPAIWALGNDNDQVGWPNAGEMDIMEAIGQDDNTIYGTIHGPSANGPWQVGSGYSVPTSIDDNFHIYGLDWSPTKVVLSVDGHAYKTILKSDVVAAGDTWVFDRPFFLLLNVAVGGSWPGSPKDNSVFPSKTAMTIDYVRVYK